MDIENRGKLDGVNAVNVWHIIINSDTHVCGGDVCQSLDDIFILQLVINHLHTCEDYGSLCVFLCVAKLRATQFA